MTAARRSSKGATWRRSASTWATQQPADVAPGRFALASRRRHKWDFGPLPASIDLRRGGVVLTKYPGPGRCGRVRRACGCCDTAAEAQRQTRLGVLRLFVLAEQRELKTQVRWLPQIEKIRLYAAPLAKDAADRRATDRPAWRRGRSIEPDEVPRDADAFEAQRLVGRKNILPAVQEVTKLALPLFEAYHELRLALEQPRPATWKYALDDIREQLAALLPDGFLTARRGLAAAFSALSQGDVAATAETRQQRHSARPASPRADRRRTGKPIANGPTSTAAAASTIRSCADSAG